MICGFCHRELEKAKRTLKDGTIEEYFIFETVPDINITENNVNSIACDPCAVLVNKLVYYRDKIRESNDSIDRMKHELNLFRSIMLNPSTLEAKADDSEPTFEHARAYAKRKTSGLEVLSLNGLLFWMEVYECFAKEISSIVNKKATAEELKAHLEEKTKQAIKDQAKKEKEVKKAKNDGLTGTYTSSEKKVILSCMKTLGLSEEKAVEQMKKMLGLTK